MKEIIPEDLLELFSNFITKNTGLYFPENRLDDLLRGIRNYARDFNFKSEKECMEYWLSAFPEKSRIECLVSYLTVGETYFLRDKRLWEVLEEQVLPELIKTRRNERKYLRIWSAGCCTGEEPYSIAILLSRQLRDLKDWDITILGTDINSLFLKKAEKGFYKEWSFRETLASLRELYFVKRGSYYEIHPSIREMVSFFPLNLAEDVYPSILNKTVDMDIIFCRNVLMYFLPELAEKAVERFYRSLSDKGWLLITPCESNFLSGSNFLSVDFNGATLYRKDPDEKREKFSVMDTVSSDYNENVWNWPDYTYELYSDKSEIQNHYEREPAAFRDFEPSETLPDDTGGGRDYDFLAELYENGRYTEVIEKLEGFFSKDNSQDQECKYMILLARAYANQRRLSEGEEWCKKAIVCNRINPEYYYLLAKIQEEQDKFEEARRSLKKVIYLDRDFAPAYFAMANLFQKEGKRKEALKYFENTLSVLEKLDRELVLEGTEGLTAGNLKDVVQVMIDKNL